MHPTIKQLSITMGLFLILTCHPAPFTLKLDPPLRKQIQADKPEIISITGRCNTEIDSTLKADLEKTGITVQSVIGPIFTARGSRESIRELARLEVILKLEAARQYRHK